MFSFAKFISKKPIKLVAGAGSPGEGACWMSAIQYYSGGEWSDHPDCVCPLIRQMCICANDCLDDESRGEIIGPHLLAPVGTNTDDELIVQERARLAVEACVQVFAPFALLSKGRTSEAAMLQRIKTPIAGHSRNVISSFAMRLPEHSSAYAACVNAADAIEEFRYSNCLSATGSAANSFFYAALSHKKNSAKFIRGQVMPVILRMCEVGSKVPVEPSCDEIQLARICGAKL